ncbi:hypothetical protein HX866_03875 [Pseudomonas gingeri]|nr:hypothetical protein [Pseudomonas gingeri]
MQFGAVQMPGSVPAIGTYWEGQGGVYAGMMRGENGQPDYPLIVPIHESVLNHKAVYGGYEVDQPGATHRFDGMANTQAMAEEGSAIARKVLGMNVRGAWGWHIPSIEELQVLRSNLLQLEDWDYRGMGQDKKAIQAFTLTEYWSSTQKENAATAWCLHMLPWCVPDTNWVSGSKGIRPVKVLQIKADAFVHEAANDAPAATQADLHGLVASPAVAEVLGHFINEDTGRFYGRTDDLLAQLAMIAGEARA